MAYWHEASGPAYRGVPRRLGRAAPLGQAVVALAGMALLRGRDPVYRSCRYPLPKPVALRVRRCCADLLVSVVSAAAPAGRTQRAQRPEPGAFTDGHDDPASAHPGDHLSWHQPDLNRCQSGCRTAGDFCYRAANSHWHGATPERAGDG